MIETGHRTNSQVTQTILTANEMRAGTFKVLKGKPSHAQRV